MIIDIHGHLGNINFAPFWQADAARLDAYAAAAGVDVDPGTVSGVRCRRQPRRPSNTIAATAPAPITRGSR